MKPEYTAAIVGLVCAIAAIVVVVASLKILKNGETAGDASAENA